MPCFNLFLFYWESCDAASLCNLLRKHSIHKKEEPLERLKDSVANVGSFLEKAKQYTQLDTLTAEIFNLFIERVEVGEHEAKPKEVAFFMR